MKLEILFLPLTLSAQVFGPRYNDCPAITSQPKFDSKLLKRIGQVWKMKPRIGSHLVSIFDIFVAETISEMDAASL